MQSDVTTGSQPTGTIAVQSSYRRLGVIIPVFNEVQTLEQILQRVLTQACVGEVIIVDDASTDGSRELLKGLAQNDPRVRVISHGKNHGKGAAVRSGLTLATSDVIVIQDADLEYDPRDYVTMLELILKGEADVVYGSRFAKQGNRGKSFWHTFGNRCLTWCSNFASGLKLTDEATCYKMFRRDIIKNFELLEDRFGFCPEFTAKISRLGLKIQEVPISYHPRTKAQGKKIRLQDGFNALSCIIEYNYISRQNRNAVMPCLMISWWPTMILALFYAFALLYTTDTIPSYGNWYSTSTAFRQQTSAFRHGELALSHNMEDLTADLCWAKGGIQQVWGLGVPLWRFPFEILAGICGQNGFPDRIAMGLFIALAAFVVLKTWLAPILKLDSTLLSANPAIYWQGVFKSIGTVYLILFFAPIINLLSTRMRVYEEVMVYAYFYGVILACGMVTLAKKPTWPRFWVLCGLAGFGGLIRPTLLFYGMATVVVGSLLMWFAQQVSKARTALRLLTGFFLFCLGGGCLFLTNLIRFGNGFEFGHRLNLQAGDLIPSVYSTRFNYPFAHEPLYSATRELFGALFQVRHLNKFNYYQQAFFPGQSETFRWREFSFTTYDITYFLGICAAFLIGILAFWRRFRSVNKHRQLSALFSQPISTASVLVLWGGIACLITAAFYVKAPVIASRYMLDFAASFVAILVGLFSWIVNGAMSCNRFSTVSVSASVLVLLVWLGGETISGKVATSRPISISQNDLVLDNMATNLRQTPLWQAEYWTATTAAASGIPFNGEGWDFDTDNTKAAVELFVKNPNCLYLDLTPRTGARVDFHDYDCIQAKVGFEFLERKNITSLTNGVRIEFNMPKKPQYQNGIQPVFLAMVKPSDLSTNDSPFRLLKVGWNE